MTTSYSQDRDVLNAFPAKDRGMAPARYAQAITPSDTQDLPVYGRLMVTNSSAGTTENITVIMAGNNQDDSTVVEFAIAPVTTIVLPIVVRRVMATNTGSQISCVVLA